MLVAPFGFGFIAPCIPTRVFEPPAGPDWVHEIEHDGYRLEVRRDGDAVRLLTAAAAATILAAGIRRSS
jgi:ATP-dependent DNA ligase